MKFKLKIQQKIQLFIISASIIIYIVAIGYISISDRKEAFKNAALVTNEIVQNYALDISNQLNSDMSIVKTLSYSYLVYDTIPKAQWKTLFKDMYLEVFKKNPHFYALWDSWELSAIDPNWTKTFGRYSMVVSKDANGNIFSDSSYRSMEVESQIYDKIIKKRRIPSIWEPYLDNYAMGENKRSLMTSLNSPILKDGKYIGIVAIDITLDNFQQIVKQINPFEGSYAYMISNGGLIAGHPNQEILNQKIEEVFPEDFKTFNIQEKIKAGEPFSYSSKNIEGVKLYYSYAPIIIKDTNTPWSIAISVPINTIMAEANRNFKISVIVGILGILLLVLVIAIIGRNIANPITKITKLLNQLSIGHLDDKMRIQIKTGDEIEEMSEALNSSIEGLNKKVDFANNIGQGELSHDFDLLSDDDILGKSLIEMRKSLVKADEDDEKRTVEDEKRRWNNEGLAKFADILRQNNDNLENLATEIIINLIGYLEANQGGVFILNDDDKENVILSLLSAYAYDRRKFMKKHIELGEGLVGNCAIEKKTIFMTAIPQDYLEITSGLGGANPNCLLIVPLKVEQNVLGVLEIASFKVFKDFEIEFVEKLAESIASTLSSVKINIRTSELLERSQQQAEEMTAQEEEMRQNMEELQATQEEMRRKENHLKNIIEEMKVHEDKLKKTIDKYKNQK
ncbi:MAG: cache domain-containing protein [Bacteroidales bacterium]|jgi:methyl-accepting chemotaxis protein|nr:cache domain-containing protein [Bacteroidales bacterium]